MKIDARTKKELPLVAGVIYWVLLIAVVEPLMISAANTGLVVGGIALLIVSAYVTYRAVRRALTKKETAA